ncbi:nitrogenase component 1 [Oscillospiraceae bacterium PP1C4]
MAKLSIWLPPFSPDYSGVSAVLFDLHTVTAMHDASGCTGNYTGYDEPRWYGSKSGIYCSGLREIDAVLGDDEKLIQKMVKAAEDIQPELMALVGSPVPMVIGSDLQGIATDLESRTGIPCFGFDTTGTDYYDHGAAMASIALLERFAQPLQTINGSVNILGATPMDFGTGENLDDLKSMLLDRNIPVLLSLAMGYCVEDLKKAAAAQINLAVSRTGYIIAQYMQQRFGIPYLCGLPVGEKGAEDYFFALERVRTQKESIVLSGSACESPNVLILGEQVQCNALRIALQKDFGMENISVGCLYGLEADLALPKDKNLSDEFEIRNEINRPEYRLVIADPFLCQLFNKEEGKSFFSLAQYAVSSSIGIDQSARLMGEHFNQWFSLRKQVLK